MKLNSQIKAYLIRRFPIVTWLPKYTRQDALGDLIAGLTVGMMAVPQSLAFAKIADLPLQYGLYCSLMAPMVYAIFGTSKDITMGPTTVLSLTVATQLSVNNITDPVLAIALSFISGIVQLAMGFMNLGFLVDFFSAPVISGFMSAVSLTLIAQQLPKIFGLTARREVYYAVFDTAKALPNTRGYDTLLGILCIIALVLLRYLGQRMSKRSGKIAKLLWFIGTARNSIIVIITIILGYSLSKSHTCPAPSSHLDWCPLVLTGPIPPGLPQPTVPDLSPAVLSQIGGSIIVITLIAFLETILIAKSFAKKYGYVVDASQELVALGLANIIGSFFLAYPATGSFSRSSVNSESGVRTPLGGLVTGIVVIICMVALTPCFAYIPTSALAAIVIAAVLTMFDYKSVPMIWRTSWRDFACLVIAFFAVLFAGVEYGIAGALALSLLFLLYDQARPKMTLVGKKEFDGGLVQYVGAREYPDVELPAGTLYFRLDGPLVFASCEHFSDSLIIMEQQQCAVRQLDLSATEMEMECPLSHSRPSSLRSVLLDFSSVPSIDLSGLLVLEEIFARYRSKNVTVKVAGCKAHVYAMMERFGLDRLVDEKRFFATVCLAAEALRHELISRALSEITVKLEGSAVDPEGAVTQEELEKANFSLV